MSSIARFSLPQYERMVEAGVFAGPFHQRVEFIRGEVRQMNPIGVEHAVVVNFLTRWSIQNTDGEQIECGIQNPIRLPDCDSSPQPDITWLVKKRYSEHPEPADVLLLIEVADTSLQLDSGEKMELYAEAAISEYWVVDIEGRALIVHRNPGADGYRDTKILSGADTIHPLADPEVSLTVNEVFSRL